MSRTLFSLILAAGWLAPGSLPAAEPVSREQLRRAIDADGRVIDPQLRQQTGWEVVRGFSWRIELEDAWQPGRFFPADARATFHSGQRFRFQIEAFCDLFVYVVVSNADGSCDVLLPLPGEQTPRLRKGQTLVLPPKGPPFAFAPPGGTHRLRLIASPTKLPWHDSEILLKLHNGQQLPTERQRTLSKPAPIPRVKGLEAAVRRIDQRRLAKGCTVELVEPAADGNLVTLTSADPKSKPILVHDVALQQAD